MHIHEPIGQQVQYLRRSIVDSCLFHSFGIVTVLFYNGPEPQRQLGAAQLADMLNLLRIGNRHHPGYHRHCNAVSQQPVHIIVHHIIVKEHLGHQKFHAAVNFYFQFFYIIIETGALRMTFRVAGAANTEIPKRFDFLCQIAGMPILRMLQRHPVRQVATQRQNIIYTSLWDNYPDAATIPLKGKASKAYLLMAGSTNHMQSRIDNGLVVVTYTDGTTDTLALRNPDNWCPIEQEYYIDGQAFNAPQPRPYRVCFGTGDVSRNLGSIVPLGGDYGRDIPGGAGQMLEMPLNPQKRLKSLTIRTLSNDVVIGLMAITLQ